MNNLKNEKDSKNLILSDESPFIYTESYKSLRTNLNFVSINNNYKIILVTSALPEEGKSIVAANLAYTLGQNGSKVLLMNCDLRKPTLQKYLGLEKYHLKGLPTVLCDMSKLEESIHTIEELKIDILLSDEEIPPNPAELLGSAKMGGVLKYLSESYDYVICDTPPVSLITDAAVLSRFSDGLLFVIKQNYASLFQVKAAKEKLETAGANIVGTVMTHFKPDKGYSNNQYYYKYSRGYHSKIAK